MSHQITPLGPQPGQSEASGKQDDRRLTGLCEFLKAPINSRTRERIFFHRLFYDLKLAAACGGYHLGLFEPDVDRDGFDVVLEDRDQVRQLQLKSIIGSAGTSRWKTRLRFLRPQIFKTGLEMGFPQSPHGEGREGGIILQCIDDSTVECAVIYYYSDVYVLSALSLGIVRGSKARRKAAAKAMNHLHRGAIDGEIELRKSNFVKAKSPSCLLGLMGLSNFEGGSTWSQHVVDANKRRFDTSDDGKLGSEISQDATLSASCAATDLLSLVDEPGLTTFEGSIPMD